MAQPRAMILRAAGTNCDVETAYAFELAGGKAERVHVNRVIENPSLLEEYQVFIIPGGFSYGDDIAAGKILANQLVHHLAEEIRRFIAADKLVLGICNGFQVLVKTGILPGINGPENSSGNNTLQQATITYNDSGKFEDRWVYLQPGTENCVFVEPTRRIYLPIAHGEGKVCFADQEVLQRVCEDGLVAFRYVDEQGEFGPYPINPNGSVENIAGLCDKTGRVMGLMPHPERFVHRTNHPQWTRRQIEEPDGLGIFRKAVQYFL